MLDKIIKGGYKISLIGIFIFLIVIVNGCNNIGSENKTYAVRDGLGEIVHIPEDVQRIVAMDIATSELSLLLLPHEKIVGVSYFMDDKGVCNLHREAKNVQGRVERNIEVVLQLDPDLLLITSPGKDEVREQLLGMNIPVFTICRPKTSADILKNIELLGVALHREEEANRLIVAMENDLATIRAATEKEAEKGKKRAVRIGMHGAAGGIGTVIDSVITEAGCINVAAELGLKEGILSHEQLVKSGAEIFLMPTWDFKGSYDIHLLQEQFENDPSMQTIPAVKNRNFIFIPDYFLISQTPYRIFAIGELAEAAYGIQWESELEKILPEGSVRKTDVYKEFTTVSKPYGDGL